MSLTWFDGNRSTEVLIKMLGNAIISTPDTGKIVVDIGCDAKTITLSVKDNGKGIPKEKADRVLGKLSLVDVAKAALGRRKAFGEILFRVTYHHCITIRDFRQGGALGLAVPQHPEDARVGSRVRAIVANVLEQGHRGEEGAEEGAVVISSM